MATDRPKITSIRFDHQGWELKEQGPQHRLWMMEGPCVVLLRFHHGRPAQHPIEFERVYSIYEEECTRNRGVIVSFEITEIATVPTVCGVFKYRSPKNPRAMAYVGILFVALPDCAYQINIESMELGDTGLRECLAMMLCDKAGKWWPGRDQPPRHIESWDEVEAEMANTPAPLLPSDDEEYDAVVKDHPLSLVRKTMRQLQANLRFDDCVKAAAKR